jgi:hypothetical protein
MQWFKSILGRKAGPPPADSQAFARRASELQQRLDRLEREVEVVQRVETREESREP